MVSSVDDQTELDILDITMSMSIECTQIEDSQDSTIKKSNVSEGYPARVLKVIDYKELEFVDGCIGKGSFGIVYRGTWKNIAVAIKKVETKSELKEFDNEILQLSRVSHENIVHAYGVAESSLIKYLVMEFADGGSLFHFLHSAPVNSYSLTNALSWLIQCARAIDYMHSFRSKPIIHRDLKPLNMLLTHGRQILKICDFGTACTMKTNMTNTKGSFAWMAPEVMQGFFYDEKCDVYSWGIILWELLTRRIPYSELGQPFRILWQVAHQRTRPPLIEGCPKPLENLMVRCWQPSSTQRPSMSEVLKIIVPIYQLITGSDAPITYRESSADSSTVSGVCLSNQGLSDGHTSQDISDLPSNVTDSQTPCSEEKNLESSMESLSIDSSNFIMVSRPISPNVSTSIVVSSSNLPPPWGSALSDGNSPFIQSQNDANYPIGTCIDMPHVPRPVVRNMSDIDPKLLCPISISVPTSQDTLNVPYVSQYTNKLSPIPQKTVLENSVSPSLHFPYSYGQYDATTSYCKTGIHVPMRQHLDYCDKDSVNYRRRSAEIPESNRASQQSYGHRRSSSYGSTQFIGFEQFQNELFKEEQMRSHCNMHPQDPWLPRPVTHTGDYTQSASVNIAASHSRPPHPSNGVSINRDDLKAFIQVLDDDLKPSMPLPSCPQSQKIRSEHEELAHQLLLVQHHIFYLDLEKKELSKKLSKQEESFQSSRQRYDDKIKQLQTANDSFKSEHASLNRRLEEMRNRKRQQRVSNTLYPNNQLYEQCPNNHSEDMFSNPLRMAPSPGPNSLHAQHGPIQLPNSCQMMECPSHVCDHNPNNPWSLSLPHFRVPDVSPRLHPNSHTNNNAPPRDTMHYGDAHNRRSPYNKQDHT